MISDRRILRSSSIIEIRSRNDLFFSLIATSNFIPRFQELLQFDIRRGIEKFTFFPPPPPPYILIEFEKVATVEEDSNRFNFISLDPQEAPSERDSIIRVLVFFISFATLKHARVNRLKKVFFFFLLKKQTEGNQIKHRNNIVKYLH